jgi:transcriptional regulator with XRE-family HTH domain
MGTKTHKLRRLENRIWKYRKISNLSQKQVSFLLALKGTTQISKWEKGVKVPSLENALRLGKVLKVSVEDLFAGVSQRVEREREKQSLAVKEPLTELSSGLTSPATSIYR